MVLIRKGVDTYHLFDVNFLRRSFSFLKTKAFSDFYCSTIDVQSLSNIIYDLIDLDFKGMINIGSSDTFSKKEFAYKIAELLKFNKHLILEGSVKSLKTRRAESLGLDVTKIERILKYKMPNLNKVCSNLIKNLKK